MKIGLECYGRDSKHTGYHPTLYQFFHGIFEILSWSAKDILLIAQLATILVIHGSRSMKSFAVELPDDFPEHFIDLPV